MGGVGALLSPRFEQAQPLAALQELVEEELFGAARQQAVPEFAQGRKVEPRIGELETQEILPVDTRGPPQPPGDPRSFPETVGSSRALSATG